MTYFLLSRNTYRANIYLAFLFTLLGFHMQTVSVIPVLPHGVVQLGSSLDVSAFTCLFT